MDKIAVLIPCYNESTTIEKVVSDFKRVLPEAVIYVYDNNSSDGTDEIAKNAGAIVRYEYRQGKGNVVRSMFRDIDADCYIMVDGDDTCPAETAVTMAEDIFSGKADMVIGDRLSSTYFETNTRRFHSWGNNWVRKMVNRIFKSDIKDVMSGYRAFSYIFVKTFPVLSRGFQIETEMSIHATHRNLKISHVPVEVRNRPQGSESKVKTWSDGWKIEQTIRYLYRTYRPDRYYSIVTGKLLIISGLFSIPVFKDCMYAGSINRIAPLIITGCTLFSAIISLFTGVILKTMAIKDQQDFEIRLNQYTDRFNKIKC